MQIYSVCIKAVPAQLPIFVLEWTHFTTGEMGASNQEEGWGNFTLTRDRYGKNIGMIEVLEAKKYVNNIQ